MCDKMSDAKKERDSWATPQWVYDYFDRRFIFSADIAASATNHKHSVFLTENDDALSVDILDVVSKGSYVWCNPPYSKVMPWIELAERNQAKGVGTVLLLKNDSSTQWFKRCHESASRIIFVVGGRIQFLQPSENVEKSSNNFSSVVVVYEPSKSSEAIYEGLPIEVIKGIKMT